MSDDQLSQPEITPAQETHWLRRKGPNCLVAIVLLLIVAVLGAPFLIVAVSGWRERHQAYELLATAADRDELADVVGRLGVLLDLPDGDWIAIRYRDSHGYQGYSIAVALTSDGRWLESTYHFCGLFSGYKHYRERIDEATTEEERQVFKAAILDNEYHRRLRRVETQYTLDQAVRELFEMGFDISSETRPARIASTKR